jgi:CRISPR-associated endonuclease/helicase Cas3
MALRELAANYGSTIVLCTATQPAVHRRDDFPIGLEGVREIISEPPRLYAALKRVSVKNLGPVSDDELVERLAEHAQVMCIVNTRRHARDLFGKCRDLEGTHHLSAAMCPAHRTERLTAIQDALHRGDPCHVVATQVVEAGVDLDFPVVYRSQAGLDSVAQAAGRCNRNGKAPQGTTFMFRSEHQESEVFIRDTANVARQLVGVEGAKPLYEDFLSLEAVEHYFRLYYWSQKDRWDKNQILDKLKLQKSKILPFLFDFETIARNFHLIEEAGEPVFVPWGPEGGHLCRQLCSMGDVVPVSLLRALQRYVVQVPPRIWDNSLTGPLSLVKGAYAVLPCLDPYYRQDVGLCLDVDQFDAEALMV